MNEDVSAAFAVERRDRRRLSALLHDQPIQGLSAAQWQLEALAMELPEPQRERLLASTRGLAAVQRQLRTLMTRLDPTGLAHDGLAIATQDLLEETFHGSATVEVSVVTDGLTEPPIGSAAVMLRLIDEAAVDALRTPSATRVAAHLRDDAEGIRFDLTVEPAATEGADVEGADVEGADAEGADAEDVLCAELAAAADGWWRRSTASGRRRTACWLPRW